MIGLRKGSRCSGLMETDTVMAGDLLFPPASEKVSGWFHSCLFTWLKNGRKTWGAVKKKKAKNFLARNIFASNHSSKKSSWVSSEFLLLVLLHQSLECSLKRITASVIKENQGGIGLWPFWQDRLSSHITFAVTEFCFFPPFSCHGTTPKENWERSQLDESWMKYFNWTGLTSSLLCSSIFNFILSYYNEHHYSNYNGNYLEFTHFCHLTSLINTMEI